MSKITAILGSALFFLVAPAMLAGVIPWLITHWEFRPPFLAAEATRLAGLAFIIAGVPGLYWLFFHIVVIAYEEPTLRQSFGAEYESYRADVPRWLPRLMRWPLTK